MYENQSHPAQFELYADPRTGEARLRPKQRRAEPHAPNPAGVVVDSRLAVRVLRLGPLAYDRPNAAANPGLRD